MRRGGGAGVEGIGSEKDKEVRVPLIPLFCSLRTLGALGLSHKSLPTFWREAKENWTIKHLRGSAGRANHVTQTASPILSTGSGLEHKARGRALTLWQRKQGLKLR